ncbi:sigma factor-like helix-turn-helix DNA-binding protein [[Phormidium] sp. ETS-05]|uniref:sigma factor-like helix-turn-helix DNA-binding protein n=1 Tax=[Phormidium] sp. ETS-05 TaxID=222819 RepID=UPI0018EEEC13|nr:sigma factor-like helix-turn-helix DNA-binding protein [[Phormidium] sp. ETS-05]
MIRNRSDSPILPDRPENWEQFATQLRLDSQSGRLRARWQCIPRLRRNMQLYETRDAGFAQLCDRPDQGESVADFWRQKVVERQSRADWEPANYRELALAHLASYLEPTCDYVAKYATNNYQEICWEDGFAIAREVIYTQEQLADFLKTYRRDGQATIKTYIQGILLRIIRAETSVGEYSQWRLLCQTSKKELRQALSKMGVKEVEISRMILARQCFKEVYVLNRVKHPQRKSGGKWPEPLKEDFGAAASSYNAQKYLPYMPVELLAGKEMEPQEMVALMRQCIQALRNQFNSITWVASLEEMMESFGYEARDGEGGGTRRRLPLPEASLDIWQSLEAEQGQSATTEIEEKLRAALRSENDVMEIRIGDSCWPCDRRKMLLMHYGLGMTEQQVADYLTINQSNVSRLLCRYKKRLLQTLTELSRPQDWITKYVSQWLKADYAAPDRADLIQAALTQALPKIPPQDQELLSLRYGRQLSISYIAQQEQISPSDVAARLETAETNLHSYLFKELDQWIKDYVKLWLTQFYHQPIDAGLIQQLNALDRLSRDMLTLRYGQRLSENQIADMYQIDATQVLNIIGQGKTDLEDNFADWLREEVDISLGRDRYGKIINSIAAYFLNLFYPNQIQQ